MLEFIALTVRFPRGSELFRLRFIKVQVSFTNVTDEQEPFATKLIEPLNTGVLNLSSGVKIVDTTF
jgi:hypothetical protein